jgi:hypothetical protein
VFVVEVLEPGLVVAVDALWPSRLAPGWRHEESGSAANASAAAKAFLGPEPDLGAFIRYSSEMLFGKNVVEL